MMSPQKQLAWSLIATLILLLGFASVKVVRPTGSAVKVEHQR